MKTTMKTIAAVAALTVTSIAMASPAGFAVASQFDTKNTWVNTYESVSNPEAFADQSNGMFVYVDTSGSNTLKGTLDDKDLSAVNVALNVVSNTAGTVTASVSGSTATVSYSGRTESVDLGTSDYHGYSGSIDLGTGDYSFSDGRGSGGSMHHTAIAVLPAFADAKAIQDDVRMDLKKIVAGFEMEMM